MISEKLRWGILMTRFWYNNPPDEHDLEGSMTRLLAEWHCRWDEVQKEYVFETEEDKVRFILTWS